MSATEPTLIQDIEQSILEQEDYEEGFPSNVASPLG